MTWLDDNLNSMICGDSLIEMKNIPDKSIDLIFCDPPYGLNYNNGDLAHNWEKVFGGDVSKIESRPIANDDEESAMQLFQDMLNQAKRILKKGACCCCCCGGGGGPKPLFAKWTLLMDQIIGFKQAVVWDKPGLGMGMHYRRNYEFVLVAQNGSPAHRWNGGNNTPNIVRIPKIIPTQKQHPTEKPVRLAEHFIKIHSNEGDLVLDMFAGNGFVGEACIKMKRNFILIEKEEKYCEIARKRIHEAQRQTRIEFK